MLHIITFFSGVGLLEDNVIGYTMGIVLINGAALPLAEKQWDRGTAPGIGPRLGAQKNFYMPLCTLHVRWSAVEAISPLALREPHRETRFFPYVYYTKS